MRSLLIIGRPARAHALRGRQSDPPALVAYERAMVAAAAHAGVAPAELRGARKMRPLKLSHARQLALYLAVTLFGARKVAVARVTGMSARAVYNACEAVEARRDDWVEDEAIEAIERRLI